MDYHNVQVQLYHRRDPLYCDKICLVATSGWTLFFEIVRILSHIEPTKTKVHGTKKYSNNKCHKFYMWWGCTKQILSYRNCF